MYNSGLTTVTGNVSSTISGLLPSPSATQTIISKTTPVNSATNTTIHTVTAGKTFYCTGVLISSGAIANVGIQVDGTDVIITQLLAQSAVSGTGGVLFTAAATKIVRATTNSGGSNCTVSIWGYEA